jgi:cbb3-type cytochrome oxidase cytochrome c subunit
LAVIHSEAPPVHRAEKRNFWFAVGSVALLLGTIWMLYADYHREWKRYQREFRALELQRASKKIGELSAQYKSSKDLQKLEADLATARKDLDAHRADLEKAKGAVTEADRKFYLAESEWKVSKSYFDAFKYAYEEARESGRGLASAEKRFKDSEARYRKAVLVLEDVNKEKDQATARVKALTGREDDVERKITSLTDLRARLQKKMATIGPNLANEVRDRPVVDFMNPSIRVQQVQLPRLFNDVNFLKVQKVDRCTTCHLAAPEKGYEDLGQPFKSHPSLDLMVNQNSKHPYDQFGCTTCHQGLDRATYFASAVHTPSSEKQEKEWEHKYGWEHAEFWDSPMLPTKYTEASCLKCHRAEVRLAGAPKLNKALDTLDRAGCYGCHKIQGSEGLRKTGPDLGHIAVKTNFEWATQWVADPRAYRPTTWMPKFFGLSNSSTPEDQKRNRVEIDAILGYIWTKSQPLDLETPPVRGDAARGRQVIDARGCLGCHRIGENPKTRGSYGRDFGPALDRVGDKVNETWLYNWLKNPKRYFRDTYMPDLRLTDQEAADTAAYLMTLRGPAPAPLPPPEEATLDAVTLEYLRARLTEGDARAKLAGMARDDKRMFLGEKLISRYGCFGCHNISGYEKALPIGTELTQEGSKLVTRLDFGYVELAHTRQDWFFQKLKEPRIFDRGKVKLPQEKLKMPDFGFTDEEATTMVTLLLGLTKEEPLLETTHRLDGRGLAVEAGRRLVQHHNCRGCHIIEGTGGAIREVIKEPGFYPPNLLSEGARVQSPWLFAFLKGPTPIRPWLTVHMPTFGFSDEEAIAVSRYFAEADSVLYPFETIAFASETPASQTPASPDAVDGKQLFTQFKCQQCHIVGGQIAPGLTAADLAPDLAMARGRLRPEWILQWLRDPQKLQPGTRMPSFFYSDGEPLMETPEPKMHAIRDYVMSLGQPQGGKGGSLVASQEKRSERGGL